MMILTIFRIDLLGLRMLLQYKMQPLILELCVRILLGLQQNITKNILNEENRRVENLRHQLNEARAQA